MASGSGTKEIDPEIISLMKELRKSFSENGTMDKLKVDFEKELKNFSTHQRNVETLQKSLNSTDERKSYREMFLELGGEDLLRSVKPDDDLDAVLKNLVKTQQVMPSPEEKERLFKIWDKVLRSGMQSSE